MLRLIAIFTFLAAEWQVIMDFADDFPPGFDDGWGFAFEARVSMICDARLGQFSHLSLMI